MMAGGDARPTAQRPRTSNPFLHSRCLQDIMRAQSAEQADFFVYLEGEAVSPGDSAFPNVPRVLHLLDLEGWMTRVFLEKLQLFIHRLLQMVRKRLVIPDEAVGEE